jgi:hypothetical protein
VIRELIEHTYKTGAYAARGYLESRVKQIESHGGMNSATVTEQEPCVIQEMLQASG